MIDLPDLPTNIETTYPDRSPGDAAHQQHHDAIHAALAAIQAAGGVVTGDDLAGLDTTSAATASLGVDGDLAVSQLPTAALPSASTITAVTVAVALPAVGAGVTVRLRVWRAATGVVDTVGTITIPAGQVAARLAASAAVSAGDILLPDITAVGTTYAGAGLTVYVHMGGTVPALPAAPAQPTGLTATAGNASTTLAWTATANTVTVIYRDGKPIASVSGSTYADTGLTNGTTYSYQVAAASPLAISTLTTAQTATPILSYAYDFSSAAQLADFTTAVGSSSGTLVEVTGGELHMHSGAAGANSANDKVSARWTKDATTHAGMRATFSYRLPASNQAPFEVYLSSDAAMTTYYQLQIQTGSYRVGKKAGGTFTSLSGTVTKIHNAGQTYWGEFFATAAGTVELRLWNDGSARPATATYTIANEASRASIPAGYLIVQTLGGSSAVALDMYFPDLTVVPL